MNIEKREKIRLKIFDNILEAIASLSVFAIIALYVIYVKKGDEVDIFEAKQFGIDFYKHAAQRVFMIFSVLFYCTLTFLSLHNVYPRVFNVFLKLDGIEFDMNAQNVLYKIVLRMLRWIKMLTCLLFAYKIWHDLQYVISLKKLGFDVLSQKSEFDILFWLCIAFFVVCIVVVIIFYSLKIKKIKQNFKITL